MVDFRITGKLPLTAATNAPITITPDPLVEGPLQSRHERRAQAAKDRKRKGRRAK